MSEFKTMRPPFENYCIHEDGRIWSKNNNRFITPYLINSGYLVIRLWEHNMEHKFLIHRLVAEYWVPNPKPEEYDRPNHIDNNRLNNHYSNLQWTNQKGNLLAARQTGRINDNRLMEIYYPETGAAFICRSMVEVCEITGAKLDLVRRIAVGLRDDPTFNGWIISSAPECYSNQDFEWPW